MTNLPKSLREAPAGAAPGGGRAGGAGAALQERRDRWPFLPCPTATPGRGRGDALPLWRYPVPVHPGGLPHGLRLFCASTMEGVVRNLSAGEMLGQVLAAKKRGHNLTHVVPMAAASPWTTMTRCSVPAHAQRP